MGQRYRKIKYGQEGNYASTDMQYIYVHYNDTGGFKSVYNPNGKLLFTNQDWDSDTDLIVMINKLFNDRDCEGAEYLTEEDFKMLKDAGDFY